MSADGLNADGLSADGLSDGDLVGRTRDGDGSAFELLYRRHLPTLYDFLRRLTRDATAAEDLTQTAFLTAFERLGSLKDPERFRPWLYSIAHHLAMNHFTRSEKTHSYDEPRLDGYDEWLATSDQPGPETGLEAGEAAELVWAAASGLAPRQYAVLDLTVRRGMTTPQVAEVLDVTTGHAAVLVHRAREALGSAVRALVLARNRTRCPQLNALVSAPVRTLTPELRATVDHHMRRCSICRGLAAELLAPEALLGAAPLIAVPARLAERSFAGVMSRSDPPGSRRRVPRARARTIRSVHLPVGKPLIWATVAVVLAGSGVTAAVLTGTGRPAVTRGRPAVAATTAPVTRAPVTTALATDRWTAEPSGTTEPLFSVSCPSTDLCVAVGRNGTVLLSHNGGASWALRTSGTRASLRSVDCFAAADCVAVGSDGVIVVSSDDGARWHTVVSAGSSSLNAVSCAGPTCWAVGDGVADVSHDGGRSFAAASIPGTGGTCGSTTNACLNAVALESSLSGYSAGGSSNIFGTTNGSDWTNLVHGSAGWFTGLSCGTVGCVAVGVAPSTSAGNILVEVGGTWTAPSSEPARTAPLAAVACGPSSCIAVGSNGTALVSTNNGRAWRSDPVSVPVSLAGIACQASGACVAVGAGGSIYRSVHGF